MDTIGKSEFEASLNMPFDLEILGRLYYQARELLLSRGFDLFNPKPEETNRFISKLLDVMIKVSAMKYHLQNYETLESHYIVQLKSECANNSHISHKTYELLYEFEAFLLQMKSALDLSVKLIGTLFPNRFKTKTFGAKGDRLINGLKSFKKEKGAKIEIIDSIISMIKDDQETWLKQAVNCRDILAHYKTIAGYGYQAKRVGNDIEIQIIHPKIAGLIARDYMQMTYSNCLEFIQDFMCLVIGMFLPKTLGVGVRNTSVSSVGEPLNKYIKYGIDINILDVEKKA